MSGELKYLKIVNSDDIKTGVGEVKETGANDGASGFYLKIHDKEYILSQGATLKICMDSLSFLEEDTDSE